MSYTVTPVGGRLTLNETDTVTSVLQNIAIILSTRRGSVPLHRGFGLPMLFLDKPLPAAIPMMVAEVHEALEEFEPRARIIKITHELDAGDPGRIIPTVEVEIDAINNANP
jgi:hypothetical protein